MFEQTQRVYALALQVMRDQDREMAQWACSLENEMDRMCWQAREHEEKQLRAGKISSQAAPIYMERLRGLERISDHADSIGFSVIRNTSQWV